MKNKNLTLLFSSILILVLCLNIIIPDAAVTKSERRKLAAFPKFTIESILNGGFSRDFEKYALDQMIYRDAFRKLKATVEFSIFRKFDNNEVFIKDGIAFKMEYPYQPLKVASFAKKIESIYSMYLREMNVYYAIIPDKNYYIQNDRNHLFLDYGDMRDVLSENIYSAKYVDLFNVLSLSDYYKSDIHWMQEKLGPVTDALNFAMGNKTAIDMAKLTAFNRAPFYGAYYGQANALCDSDTLTYLTSQWIESAVVTHYSSVGVDQSTRVYDLEKSEGLDGYDIFLSGPTPIVEIVNTENTSGKSLIIFRDSFASSLAPLLLESYHKITLVDLRYISVDLLAEYIEFTTQDVLFLYNTLIINNSDMLKI